VLESEDNTLAELEVSRFATELPNDLASFSIDLVSGVNISCGDEIVALVVFVNRVDVKVIPCV
jgi:hypothetical protein